MRRIELERKYHMPKKEENVKHNKKKTTQHNNIPKKKIEAQCVLLNIHLLGSSSDLWLVSLSHKKI